MSSRPIRLAKATDAKTLQRNFYVSPLKPSRWNKIPVSAIDPLFGGTPAVVELPIWVNTDTKTVGLGTAPSGSKVVGYLTKPFYDQLLKTNDSSTPSPTIVNDGIAMCIGKNGTNILVIIDAYWGPRKTLRGGDAGDNPLPCKIPAPRG